MAMSMSQAVADFMLSEEVDGLSKSSQKRTRVVMKKLIEVMGRNRKDGKGGNEPVARLSKSHIDKVLTACRQQGNEKSTLNAYRSELRKFGHWCVITRETGVKVDPTLHLRYSHTETDPNKRKPISRDQARALIELASAMHPRDGMSAKLMLLTGLRESEIIGLQWGDVGEPTSPLFAKAQRPKREDWHNTYWTPQLRIAVAEWREYVESRLGPIQMDWFVVPALAHRSAKPGFWKMHPDWPMVPTKPQNSLGKRVKLWLAMVGESNLNGRASHTLRRTAANMVQDKSKNIRVTQKFLGHKAQSMTEIYLDQDMEGERLREELEDFEI